MNQREMRLEKLYEIYSRNLTWVKLHSNVSFKPDFEEGYLCPLCFRVFDKTFLKQDSENPLTYDHNPPKSLSGKNGILSCKECNSKSGHQLDNHLLLKIEELDFEDSLRNHRPTKKTKTILKSDSFRVTADYEVEEDGTTKINIDRRNSNPLYVDNFIANRTYNYKLFDPFSNDRNTLNSGLSWQLNFTVNKTNKFKERHAYIALLKIAYLYAYQEFGNFFLVNPYLFKIREQILNPDKEILSKGFLINYAFSDDVEGINIIKEPKELRCFLIVFSLTAKSIKRQFAIALPGFSEPGLNIYSNIEALLFKGKDISISLDHIDTHNYVLEKRWTFASYQH